MSIAVAGWIACGASVSIAFLWSLVGGGFLGWRRPPFWVFMGTNALVYVGVFAALAQP